MAKAQKLVAEGLLAHQRNTSWDVKRTDASFVSYIYAVVRELTMAAHALGRYGPSAHGKRQRFQTQTEDVFRVTVPYLAKVISKAAQPPKKLVSALTEFFQGLVGVLWFGFAYSRRQRYDSPLTLQALFPEPSRKGDPKVLIEAWAEAARNLGRELGYHLGRAYNYTQPTVNAMTEPQEQIFRELAAWYREHRP